jgi:spore coat polysaccharide biosynthesis protein SpsF
MSEQEDFWAGSFGTDYISRNNSSELLAANTYFFAKALKFLTTQPVNLIEIGANIGMNVDALRSLFPNLEFSAIEINDKASQVLTEKKVTVYTGSVNSIECNEKFDIVLSKGVLIHISPDLLDQTYERIYNLSNRWILIAEYYNPVPVALNYRGYENKLFKRDFAGEMLDKFADLELCDYGFAYHKDKFAQDDISWFLLQKVTNR